MEKIDAAAVSHILSRLGLKEDQKTLEKLAPLFQQYQKRLQALHDAPVNHEEIAARFSPGWNEDES